MTKLYICNRKACGDVCPDPLCHLTTKIEFAVDLSEEDAVRLKLVKDVPLEELEKIVNRWYLHENLQMKGYLQ